MAPQLMSGLAKVSLECLAALTPCLWNSPPPETWTHCVLFLMCCAHSYIESFEKAQINGIYYY